MRERGVPLATLESDTPLGGMDALAFHLTHELCYTNVLYMLDLAGVPLRSAERDRSHPLVMAGGGCAFNAEPLAPFVDLMVLGEGEEVLPEILGVLGRARKRGLDRNALLEELSALTGVYVPSFFEAVADGGLRPVRPGIGYPEKRVVADLENSPYPCCQPVALADTVHDRLAVEIARGCTRGCRFCQAGMIYRPVRERSPEELGRIIGEALAETGYEEMSFMSLSTGDYSALEELFEQEFPRCAGERVAVSLPSLRVGSVSEGVMRRISHLRRTGATLAPEAGSARLREVINKGISEQDLLEHAGGLFANGWRHVKLYFMIGLPTEKPEDLEAIAGLCRKVRLAGGKGAQVTASISPFVPKPHTPFQWERQIGLDEVRERLGYLRELFRSLKGVKLKWHTPEMSLLEGVFSRGDRRLAPVLLSAFEKGALFTSWRDHLDLETWLEALAEQGMSADEWLAQRDAAAPLPWEHLSCGVGREYLLAERDRALAGRRTPDCRLGACRECGVCTGLPGRHVLSAEKHGDLRPRVTGGRGGKSAEAVDPAEREPDGRPSRPDLGDCARKAAHLRVWHGKEGQAAHLSQIELQRALERAMRRARLPMSFSEGYHPMPRMSFGRALPVGVASREEWFNIFLHERLEPEEVARALGGQLPGGIEVLRVEELSMGRKQGHSLFEDFLVQYRGAEGEVREAVAAWLAVPDMAELTVTRRTGKGTKSRDARPLIAEVRDAGYGAVAVRFDWREGYVSPLATVLSVTPDFPPERVRAIKLRQWMSEPAASAADSTPSETGADAVRISRGRGGRNP
jgi:radical SAM family uncharacterized protein/radical SAM-linked protein